MGVIACVVAFSVTYAAARKSLGKGFVAVAAFGYAYGIYRAHFADTLSYFLFDFSVLGMYVAVLPRVLQTKPSPGSRIIRHWVLLLIALPLVLLFIPIQDPWIQLVGFRGNAWFLPCAIIGSALVDEDLRYIGVGLAILNLASLAVATAEFIWGVEAFVPFTVATDIIYRSNDVGIFDSLRIPGTFVSAHSYGAQMMLSLPFIVGAWAQPRTKSHISFLLLGGIFSAMLGVFLSATRLNFIFLLVMATASCFLIKLRSTQKLALITTLLLVGYVVSEHQRMQRFTTLADRQTVKTRVEQSVNASIVDAIAEYPMGNGLGAGGTSIPATLADRANIPLLIENEYARIQLELGVFGLALWLMFLLWFFTRRKPRRNEPWFVGRTLGWFACAVSCINGFIGIGLLTAIPFSALLLLQFGWLARTSLSYQRSRLWPEGRFFVPHVNRMYGNFASRNWETRLQPKQAARHSSGAVVPQ